MPPRPVVLARHQFEIAGEAALLIAGSLHGGLAPAGDTMGIALARLMLQALTRIGINLRFVAESQLRAAPAEIRARPEHGVDGCKNVSWLAALRASWAFVVSESQVQPRCQFG